MKATIIFIIFFAVTMFFTSKLVAEIRETRSLKGNVKRYFEAERSVLKKIVILAVIATLSILIFGKYVSVFSLAALHIISLFFLWKLKKISDTISGKTERFSVKFFTLQKFMAIIGIVIVIANLII